MIDPAFAELFPLAADTTPYRRLDGDFVAEEKLGGRTILTIRPEALTELARTAFHDIAFFYRPGHLAQLRAIVDDPEASANDRFVALQLLKNANISAGKVLPSCQDTGTAIVMAYKGENVFTGALDAHYLSEGVAQAYLNLNLRYSHLAPLSMFQEQNTKNNLPAQIDILAARGEAYKFLFIAKGGGSANKTFLHQKTPSVLNPKDMTAFLEEAMRAIGTAACPPYHLAVVIGGTSAEQNLKTVKLASTRYLDGLPAQGSATGHAFRDLEMEEQLLEMSRRIGIGAQFGGKYFCHDVRVIRLPRHSASVPVGIGVSCSADRQVLAKITRDGVFVEQLEFDPAKYLPEPREDRLSEEVVRIDLNRPMPEILETLRRYPVKTRVALTGPMIVARDMAHARLKERLEKEGRLPDYFTSSPVYYAGPAKTPEGMAAGSFGPTTAGRMDSYVDQFQKAGGSMVMIAKGNRSPAVAKACRDNGGFYLGSIGGSAAQLTQGSIRKMEVVDYEELGMEAVWRIEVEDFPAFIITDDKGNDFFSMTGPKGKAGAA